jgi:hypothetical protein
MLAKAGEHYCARQHASLFWSHFTAGNICCNPVCVPWSEAGHRARQT